MENFYVTESFWQALSNYAALKKKSLMYFSAVGLKNSTNQENIDQVVEHYSNICPPEIVDSLKMKEHNILFFEDSYAARLKSEEWFPFVNEMDIEEYNVYVHIFDAEGNSVFENLPFLKYD